MKEMNESSLIISNIESKPMFENQEMIMSVDESKQNDYNLTKPNKTQKHKQSSGVSSQFTQSEDSEINERKSEMNLFSIFNYELRGK